MDRSQLSVLAHKHLGSQNPVEIWNVDKVKIGSHVSFICRKQPRSKTIVRKTSHQSEGNKTLKEMKKEANYKTNSLVRRPKPRVSHPVLPLGLGSEDRHAIHPRRLDSHLSCPCWI